MNAIIAHCLQRAVFTVLCGTAGCIPLRWVQTPTVVGVALDEDTKQPISRGDVEMCGPLEEVGEDHFIITSRTKTLRSRVEPDGQFKITPTYFIWWRPLFLPADLMAEPCLVSVQSPGFVTSRRLLTNGDDDHDLGRVVLRRAAR